LASKKCALGTLIIVLQAMERPCGGIRHSACKVLTNRSWAVSVLFL